MNLTPDFSGNASINLALGLVMVIRLHNGDMHAVGLGEGP